ncbi:hypothetical protein BT69DRAFT_1042292 [Atractiella rhizophila]|nr:hypothetical protein BT69DRAFT_1042292 [Atractiella rhizophila]
MGRALMAMRGIIDRSYRGNGSSVRCHRRSRLRLAPKRPLEKVYLVRGIELAQVGVGSCSVACCARGSNPPDASNSCGSAASFATSSYSPHKLQPSLQQEQHLWLPQSQTHSDPLRPTQEVHHFQSRIGLEQHHDQQRKCWTPACTSPVFRHPSLLTSYSSTISISIPTPEFRSRRQRPPRRSLRQLKMNFRHSSLGYCY